MIFFVGHVRQLDVFGTNPKILCLRRDKVIFSNSHRKSVIISVTIFYIWDYYNHIVKSTIIILYYIFLVDVAIKNIFPLREI